ncbi:WD40 repeat-like protein [Gyrodon lividus]|nr:WD40 repeat-like protein [Gyrodon lividus]
MDMSSRLYDRARNAYRRVIGLPVPTLVLFGHTDWIRSVAFLPGGKEVISGSDDSRVRMWRVRCGREVETAMKEKSWVLAVAASGDGRLIATAGMEGTITIWNATTHEKVDELKGHLQSVRSLAFSPDSTRAVSGSADQTVIVWSMSTGERVAGPLKGHSGIVVSVGYAFGTTTSNSSFCQLMYMHIRLHGHPMTNDSSLGATTVPSNALIPRLVHYLLNEMATPASFAPSQSHPMASSSHPAHWTTQSVSGTQLHDDKSVQPFSTTST